MNLGAIEAGGTKFRAAVVTSELEVADQAWIPTTTPDETFALIGDFFAGRTIDALGIASFGPLVVDRASPHYGSIVKTPKPGWSGAPLLRHMQDALGVPIDIQTDVEAAAVAEYEVGAGRGYSTVGYVTVGTGIGAAIALDGVPYRGRAHTELGHIPVRRIPGDDFAGRCPFHQDCLEGMACGPALEDRFGAPAETLGDRDDVWELEAQYLAQLVRSFTLSFAPDIVLFGGGVGTREGLAVQIASAAEADLGGYAVDGPPAVQTAELGADAGLLGAALLARNLLA